MRIGAIKILLSNCITGIYLRWWFNGWHYYNFTNGYTINMSTESMGTQVSRFFSVISKIERPTRIKSKYAYRITVEGIRAKDIGGFLGILMAEKVEQYESGVWREVDITRGSHLIRDTKSPGFEVSFEVTRKEIPGISSVYQKSLRLYLGDTLCDLDDDEVIPVSKQVNDIAEMQDRQSDFTAQFRIRKTRAMKALFELSGEVGASTDFPYEIQTCKLVQDNIEMITDGDMILDRVDDQYYHVSILSGNKSFFSAIEKLKINDLTLASMNHTWNVPTMANTHAVDLDYVYPLCEPSDDGGIIAPPADTGDRIDMYGGWIWCFAKVKAIWDEIFSNAGYTVEGDILTDDIFTHLYIPIISRSVTKAFADRYLFSMWWGASLGVNNGDILGNIILPGVTVINGDDAFRDGEYWFPFDGTYKIAVSVIVGGAGPTLSVYLNNALDGTMTPTYWSFVMQSYEYEITGIAGDFIDVRTTANHYFYFDVRVTEITEPLIAYGSPIEPHYYLPAMTQTDFVKMICNMFGLIPDVTPRDKKIKFWNYSDLYNNIPIARDWSAYLSERDDEVEFKYGDYAQDNWLRYRESEDVIKDSGSGSMVIDDETLPEEKEVVELPISTCDEVTILTNIFGVNVSRINFNTYNPDTAVYDANETIDPRIVFVDITRSVASPAYEKTMGLSATFPLGAITDIDSPKKASSLECSFSYLIAYYASLSRLLTKTNLRRAKFNLPVYEVAVLKHYVPIYLSQYKAYFYVNKINNYVPGQLCKIDLIKL